jgi:hypothetical protein
MIVNLDRLREAREFSGSFVDSGHENVTECLDAVLDAEDWWWCALAERVAETADYYDCDRHQIESSCGWVVLVPVQGGQR